jgi:hypothetical protein
MPVNPEEELVREEIRDIAESLGMTLVETIRVGGTMALATFENDTRKLDTKPLKKLWRDLADKLVAFAERD